MFVIGKKNDFLSIVIDKYNALKIQMIMKFRRKVTDMSV